MIDNYNTLPVGKYTDILAVCKDTTLEEIDRQIKVISILSGLSEEDLLDMDIARYTDLATNTHFLEVPCKEDKRIAKTYNLGGFELVPCTDLRKVTTSQYIDFQTFSKYGEEKIAEILSVFLVPRGKRYCRDYDVIEVQDAIKRFLPVSDAVTLSAFFLDKFYHLMRTSLNSSRKMLRRVKDKEKRERLRSELRMVQSLLK